MVSLSLLGAGTASGTVAAVAVAVASAVELHKFRRPIRSNCC